MARMKHATPARKITLGALAGALTTIAVYVLNTHVLTPPLPADVAVAIGTVVTFVVGYMVSPSERDEIVQTEPAPQT